jgi:hypothetical protein
VTEHDPNEHPVARRRRERAEQHEHDEQHPVGAILRRRETERADRARPTTKETR